MFCVSFQINYIVSDSEFHILNSWRREDQSVHEVTSGRRPRVSAAPPPTPELRAPPFCRPAHVGPGGHRAPEPAGGSGVLQHPARARRRRGVAVQNHGAAAREADGVDGHGRQGRQQGADYLPHRRQKVPPPPPQNMFRLYWNLSEPLCPSAIPTFGCWRTTSRRPFWSRTSWRRVRTGWYQLTCAER